MNRFFCPRPRKGDYKVTGSFMDKCESSKMAVVASKSECMHACGAMLGQAEADFEADWWGTGYGCFVLNVSNEEPYNKPWVADDSISLAYLHVRPNGAYVWIRRRDPARHSTFAYFTTPLRSARESTKSA